MKWSSNAISCLCDVQHFVFNYGPVQCRPLVPVILVKWRADRADCRVVSYSGQYIFAMNDYTLIKLYLLPCVARTILLPEYNVIKWSKVTKVSSVCLNFYFHNCRVYLEIYWGRLWAEHCVRVWQCWCRLLPAPALPSHRCAGPGLQIFAIIVCGVCSRHGGWPGVARGGHMELEGS